MALTCVATLWCGKYLLDIMKDGMNGPTRDEVKAIQVKLARKLGRPEIINMEFDGHESSIMQDVLCPSDLNVSFDDIGGMSEELKSIVENICTPLQLASAYEDFDRVAPIPTGVLLYGPPGTGKTLSARAIAKEANATFVVMKCSTVMSKWYGESNKTIGALFSLARKLAPSIIFLDEVDTLLGNRGQSDSSAHQSLLGNVLAEWDGLQGDAPVVVLGTTNRPHDLDKAFLRRMPLMIKTSTPTYAGRIDILRKMLVHEKLEEDVDIEGLALKTDNYSGSDLREFVRLATTQRAKELVVEAKKMMERAGAAGAGLKKLTMPEVRPLRMADFNNSIDKARCTGDEAFDYEEENLLSDALRQKEVLARVQRALAEAKDLGPKNIGTMD